MSDYLTAIILTLNEEANLPDCLESLVGLDCRVLVVDSGSTDRTVVIARDAGASVLVHQFDNYSEQRNWAQDHLPWKTDWLLHLDADERVTPELVAEINLVVKRQSSEPAGYLLRKRTVFLGRWIRHGGHYPAYHLRLYRYGNGGCEPRLYDQHFLVNGKVEKLQYDYIDVLTSDLTTWTVRHARWATMEAREALERCPASGQVPARLFGSPIERRRWLRNGPYYHAPLFLRAYLYWSYRYFFRLGILDGVEGLIFHFLQGFWYRVLVDAKIWELSRKASLVRIGQNGHHL